MSVTDGCVHMEGLRAWAGYPLQRDALEVFVVRDDLAAGSTEVLRPDGSWESVRPEMCLGEPTVTVQGWELFTARMRERVDPVELVRVRAPEGFGDVAAEAARVASEVRV